MDITFERNRNYKEIVASNYKEKSKILEEIKVWRIKHSQGVLKEREARVIAEQGL